MSYIPASATCRVCGEMTAATDLIKYGVRHYAHAKCGIEKWGVTFFDRLRDWQVERFPAAVASRAGLLPELVRRCDAIAAKVAQ